jgi:hypothetical protein
MPMLRRTVLPPSSGFMSVLLSVTSSCMGRGLPWSEPPPKEFYHMSKVLIATEFIYKGNRTNAW